MMKMADDKSEHSIHVKCVRCGRRFWVARFLSNGQDRSEALCVPCGTRSPIWLAEIKPKSADHARGKKNSNLASPEVSLGGQGGR